MSRLSPLLSTSGATTSAPGCRRLSSTDYACTPSLVDSTNLLPCGAQLPSRPDHILRQRPRLRMPLNSVITTKSSKAQRSCNACDLVAAPQALQAGAPWCHLSTAAPTRASACEAGLRTTTNQVGAGENDPAAPLLGRSIFVRSCACARFTPQLSAACDFSPNTRQRRRRSRERTVAPFGNDDVASVVVHDARGAQGVELFKLL